MTKFETELIALLKKHNITSLDKLCYNDPEKVAEYKKAKEEYREAFDAYNKWVNNCPKEPDIYEYDIVNEYDDDEYINEGVWYSSKCRGRQ